MINDRRKINADMLGDKYRFEPKTLREGCYLWTMKDVARLLWPNGHDMLIAQQLEAVGIKPHWVPLDLEMPKGLKTHDQKVAWLRELRKQFKE